MGGSEEAPESPTGSGWLLKEPARAKLISGREGWLQRRDTLWLAGVSGVAGVWETRAYGDDAETVQGKEAGTWEEVFVGSRMTLNVLVCLP